MPSEGEGEFFLRRAHSDTSFGCVCYPPKPFRYKTARRFVAVGALRAQCTHKDVLSNDVIVWLSSNHGAPLHFGTESVWRRARRPSCCRPKRRREGGTLQGDMTAREHGPRQTARCICCALLCTAAVKTPPVRGLTVSGSSDRERNQHGSKREARMSNVECRNMLLRRSRSLQTPQSCSSSHINIDCAMAKTNVAMSDDV